MGTKERTRRGDRREGFTLVELLIVCVVIGILAAIAIPNYARTKAHASVASCISNQRNLYAVTTIYVGDHGIRDAVLGSETLLAEHVAASTLTDCPDDHNDSHDDYEVTVENGEVTEVVCLLYPADHVWHH